MTRLAGLSVMTAVTGLAGLGVMTAVTGLTGLGMVVTGNGLTRMTGMTMMTGTRPLSKSHGGAKERQNEELLHIDVFCVCLLYINDKVVRKFYRIIS